MARSRPAHFAGQRCHWFDTESTLCSAAERVDRAAPRHGSRRAVPVPRNWLADNGVLKTILEISVLLELVLGWSNDRSALKPVWDQAQCVRPWRKPA